MALMRTARLLSAFTLLLLPTAHAESNVGLDTASDALYVAHGANVAPAAEQKQARSLWGIGLKALRPRATVAGLTIAAGATVYRELKCQGTNVPAPWSRFFGVAHKNCSAASTRATGKRGWQAPAWVGAVVSLSLAGFVTCMIRRKHLESRRISLVASRAVLALPVKSPNTSAAQSPKESPRHSSRASTWLGSTPLSSKRTSLGATPLHSSRTSTPYGSSLHLESGGTESKEFPGIIHSGPGECTHGLAVVAITETLIQKKKKAPVVPKLALEAYVPWGEGLVSQRTAWFEETAGPADTDDTFNCLSARSRPTGEEIDEWYRQSTCGSTWRSEGPRQALEDSLEETAGPAVTDETFNALSARQSSRCSTWPSEGLPQALEDSLEDVLDQKRQESEKSGGALESDDSMSRMYSEYSTGAIFAA